MRKYGSALLIVLLLCALTACGGKEEPAAAQSASAESASSAAAPVDLPPEEIEKQIAALQAQEDAVYQENPALWDRLNDLIYEQGLQVLYPKTFDPAAIHEATVRAVASLSANFTAEEQTILLEANDRCYEIEKELAPLLEAQETAQ